MLDTLSVCPVCFKQIPAGIDFNGCVSMHKTCPTHGSFHAMIERDPLWYAYTLSLQCHDAYEGYMVDVTNKCNLHCKYCYHPNRDEHRSVEDVLAEVENIHVPILLSGGEPTLHPELWKILNALYMHETWVLTNGVLLQDQTALHNLASQGHLLNHIGNDTLITLALSLHLDVTDAGLHVLDNFRENKWKIGNVFYVADSLDGVEEAMNIAYQYRDVIMAMRIKAATTLWAEGKQSNLYVSDMVKFAEVKGASLDHTKNIKPYYAPMSWFGMTICMVRWYDKWNVDIRNIEGQYPHYRSVDGSVNSIALSCINNERLACTQ